MKTTFQTLAKAVETTGIALHSGAQVRLRILPSENCGIVFARTDLPDLPQIAASFENISRTVHATTLHENGASVSTTEHLLAALWMNSITHCRIELDGAEVPILDGSARDWQSLLEEAATVEVGAQSSTRFGLPRPIFGLREAVYVEHEKSSVLALPSESLRVSVFADFGLDYLAPQLFDGTISAEFFAQEIAASRTFTLEKWIEPLRAQALIAGGSTENAIVLGETAPSSPLRFANELARHKALDLLGDIALMFAQNGGILRAHFVAVRAGHALHQAWMNQCLAQNALQRLN